MITIIIKALASYLIVCSRSILDALLSFYHSIYVLLLNYNKDGEI